MSAINQMFDDFFSRESLPPNKRRRNWLIVATVLVVVLGAYTLWSRWQQQMLPQPPVMAHMPVVPVPASAPPVAAPAAVAPVAEAPVVAVASTDMQPSPANEVEPAPAPIAPMPAQERQPDAAALLAASEAKPRVEGKATKTKKEHSNARVAEPEPTLAVKQVSPQQQADYLYAQAQTQDRSAARESLAKSLVLAPQHLAARSMLANLLLEMGRLDEAETTIQAGLTLEPDQEVLLMALARLKVERKDVVGAMQLLQQYRAKGRGSADFLAFQAALALRANQPQDAAEAYRAALARNADVGAWWIGLGMALGEAKQPTAAKEAFRHALQLGNLSPQMAAYAQRQLND